MKVRETTGCALTLKWFTSRTYFKIMVQAGIQQVYSSYGNTTNREKRVTKGMRSPHLQSPKSKHE